MTLDHQHDNPCQADLRIAGEVADLLAWTRRLTEAGHHADPAERHAYQTAKADLLARITHSQRTGHHNEGGTG